MLYSYLQNYSRENHIVWHSFLNWIVNAIKEWDENVVVKTASDSNVLQNTHHFYGNFKTCIYNFIQLTTNANAYFIIPKKVQLIKIPSETIYRKILQSLLK